MKRLFQTLLAVAALFTALAGLTLALRTLERKHDESTTWVDE